MKTSTTKLIVPHWNINGPPAVGKTELFRFLNEVISVIPIPRATSKKRRPGDKMGVEYIFYPDNISFLQSVENGEILEWSTGFKTNTRVIPTQVYLWGIFARYLWPNPAPETRLMLSILGLTHSVRVKRDIAPEMVNILLIAERSELIDRQERRQGRKLDEGQLRGLDSYLRMIVEKDYDYVIDTTDLTPREYARQMAQDLGVGIPMLISP